jgi:ATP-binding cassette subfamily B protein
MLGSLFLVERQVFVAEIAAVSVSFLIMIVLIIRARKRFPALQLRLDRLNLITKEKITGVRTIRSFGREDYEEARGRDANKGVYEADMAANRPLKFVSPSILTVINLSMVFIYLTGAQETADGLMKISTLLLTIQYVNSLIPSLSVLPIVFNMVPGAGTGLARIGELMEYSESGIPDRPVAGPEAGTFSLSSDPIVSLEHVSFGYEGHKTTLEDISFEVPKGSRIGIVGATGSGKSTLLQLMCGLCRPQEGRILAGGAPLDQLTKDMRMSVFSYVPQKAMVFQDSARENILAYHDGIDEEAVRRACHAAAFAEVADGMENGLDTMMAQGGMNLSGGQRKRLSLARGLAKDAAVYLLDDPFAALDAVTARAVRDNTLRLLEGKTIVMVAQRFSQLMDFDQIIMMSQGKIAAVGTHEELLDGCSEYADMFRIQCSLASETKAL